MRSLGKLILAAALVLASAASASAQATSQFLSWPSITFVNGIGTTSTDGQTLSNVTPSTASVTAQYSPRLKWCGTAWNSSGTASEIDCWILENEPATNAGTTTEQLVLKSSIAGGAFSTVNSFSSSGGQTLQSGGFLGFSGRSIINSTADGLFNLFNSGANGFTRLNFGGTTSSFVGFGSSATALTQVLADGTSGGTLASSGAQITVGSGTGITVNDAGSLRQQIYKVTIDKSFFIAGAAQIDVTLGTLPAKTIVNYFIVDLTQVFACSATCTTNTLVLTCGKTAGGTEYLISSDVHTGLTQFGDAQAELGTALKTVTPPNTPLGDLPSWSATTTLQCRLAATGNIGTGAATNLSTGSFTAYAVTTRMP